MEKQLKVLYDHQIFEAQNIGGIPRYFAELLKYNPDAKLSLRYSDNLYLTEEYVKNHILFPKNHEYDRFFIKFRFKGKGRFIRYYTKLLRKNNQAISINFLKKSEFDVFHPTYYDPYFLNYIKDKPFVLTVHDMIYEKFPQYFTGDTYTVLNKRKTILAANQIITVSEHTKRDLLYFFPELQEKITVIYHGSTFPILSCDERKENYILFTGGRGGYKNFDAFVRAIAPLLIKYNLRLVCTGQPFNDKERTLLESLHIADRTTCKLADEKELMELYSKATAFVFPSLYEGFGIPVLEAFATGCPAVLSNTSSLPEAGGGGLFILILTV